MRKAYKKKFNCVGKNVQALLNSRGGGVAPVAAAAAPAAGGDAPAGGKPAEKPKEKVEEVDALEGGMDMFGGGDKGDY